MKKFVAVLLLLTIVSGSVFAESIVTRDPLGPFLLNLFLGCGIGSYVQGDTTGGVIGTVGEIAPYAVLCAATAKYINDLMSPAITEEKEMQLSQKYATTSTLCALAVLGVRIFECIRPFTFEEDLAASIGARDINFAAIPVPTSASNVDIALNCKIDF